MLQRSGQQRDFSENRNTLIFYQKEISEISREHIEEKGLRKCDNHRKD